MCILHNIHQICPALESGALEDRQERKAKIIEICDSIV